MKHENNRLTWPINVCINLSNYKELARDERHLRMPLRKRAQQRHKLLKCCHIKCKG